VADKLGTGTKKARKREVIPENESKLDRFHRVAEPRIRKALKDIDLVIACTNKATYEVAPEDVDRIQDAFAKKVAALASAFSGQTSSEESFSFRR